MQHGVSNHLSSLTWQVYFTLRQSEISSRFSQNHGSVIHQHGELTLLQLFLSFSSVRAHLGAPPLPPTPRHLQQQVPPLSPLLPLLCLLFANPVLEQLADLLGNTHCYSGKSDTRQMRLKCPKSVYNKCIPWFTKSHTEEMSEETSQASFTLFLLIQFLLSTLFDKSVTNHRRQPIPLLHCWKYLKCLFWTELKSASPLWGRQV